MLHYVLHCSDFLVYFFFNDTATTEIYTLSLHDALPISRIARGSSPSNFPMSRREDAASSRRTTQPSREKRREGDRKSTRLNSSHGYISYAVFCLKKKKIDYVKSDAPIVPVLAYAIQMHI